MDFSFILPSRGNKADLKKMLDSFERTTAKKKELEVLIVFDKGTAEDVPAFIENQHYGFSIKCYFRPHSEWWSRDYFNFLADRSSGKNICAFNDDAWMKTLAWDDKLRKLIKDSGWSVYLIDIPDSARIKYRHNFSCFPMISRKGFVSIGYFFNPSVKVYPLDNILYSVYEAAGRIICAKDVYIQHEHIIESDPSKNRLMQIFLEQKEAGELNINITSDVMTLLKAGQKDNLVKKSKLQRIIELIKER